MAFLGRAQHLELAQLCMHGLEPLARLSGGRLDAIRLLSQIRQSLFGRSHVPSQRFEPDAVCVEQVKGLVDQPLEPGRLALDLAKARLRRSHTHLEFSIALFQTHHFGVQGKRALDERRIGRLRFCGTAGQRLQGLARVAKPMLRPRELLVSGTLFLLQPCD